MLIHHLWFICRGRLQAAEGQYDIYHRSKAEKPQSKTIGKILQFFPAFSYVFLLQLLLNVNIGIKKTYGGVNSSLQFDARGCSFLMVWYS